jgi:pimeloyl-ACP methyl ester carboxylesterase
VTHVRKTLFFCILAWFPMAGLSDGPPLGYGPELEGFSYPYPVQHYTFTSQHTSMQMAFMDVAPAGAANGRTAVLMHGKNFCSATWEQTIADLIHTGYRVIAPDQIGFCASSKPAHYQYTFQQLAANTRALLTQLGISRVTLIGHSTGGMLATRYALMFPQEVEQVVLVNPIGLEDWKALGVPTRTVDQWFERELKLTADSVRQYEKTT